MSQLPLQNSLFVNSSEGLVVVYAKCLRYESFSKELFEGYKSLRVLTYSFSLGAIMEMINSFESVECIFGYEGVIGDFSDVLAFQKNFMDGFSIVIKGMENNRKSKIIQKITEEKAKFYVVKDSIAHAKIYLLENDKDRRVIVGSANLSERAFSGKQSETLQVFDNDELAWEIYDQQYLNVLKNATSRVELPETNQDSILIEETPIFVESKQSIQPITVYVNTDVQRTVIPATIRVVEKLAQQYRSEIKSITAPRNGSIAITQETVRKIISLVRRQKREDQVVEPTWLSINRETQKVLLSGQSINLDIKSKQFYSDAKLLAEYFNNFEKGFHGNVAQHQKDYFLFMSWIYFAPFICELRNRSIAEGEYIFDYPIFAVLYGKSNCGKTRLIETLLRSMFGEAQFVDKSYFTRTNLRDLLFQRKRYPVVFDDVEKKRFTDHAMDLIKDELFMLEEYPPFVLSMNAEDHSFSTEIRKRCLILYTRASLPDNTEISKDLYKSIRSIQGRIGMSFYQEYLKRILLKFHTNPFPSDILMFSSETLVEMFSEALTDEVPHWCKVTPMREYQGRKYDKIQLELRRLYETNPDIWEVRRHDVILKVPTIEAYGLRKEVPDWLLKEGSKAGNLVLDRKPLEEFLGLSLVKGWRKWLKFQR